MAGDKGSVSVGQAVVVLTVFAALLFGWAWARSNMVTTAFPYHMAATGHGDVLVAFEQHLYRVAPDGSVTTGADLPELSASVGLAMHDPDSVFVYLGGQRAQGFFANLRRLMRLSPAPRESDINEGIYLCGWRGDRCRPFSEAFVASGSTRMLWDPDHQQLLVADTSNHRVYVLDGHGLKTATLDDFYFPNGMWRHGDTLWVADTNHHRIAGIDLDDPGASTEVTEIRPAGEHVWPTTVQRVGDENWVLVANDSLAEGRLYRYDNDWNLLERSARSLADIVNLAPLGQGALVVDMAGHGLWRLDAQGTPVAQVELPGLAGAQAHWHFWRNLSWGIAALFVLALLAGFAYATVSAKREGTPLFTGAGGNDIGNARGHAAPQLARGQTLWIDKNAIELRLWALRAMLALYLVSLGLLFWVLARGDQPDQFSASNIPPFMWLLYGGMLLLIMAGLLALRRVRHAKIGIRDGKVILAAAAGKQAQASGQRLSYNRNLLVIDDLWVPLGQTQGSTARNYWLWNWWNPGQMRTCLQPLLGDARRIGWTELPGLAWRLRIWPWLLFWAGLAMVLVALLASLLTPNG